MTTSAVTSAVTSSRVYTDTLAELSRTHQAAFFLAEPAQVSSS
jgi:hypothetical protein